MTQYHLLNTGSATSPEDTWANAYTTLANAAAGMATSDVLFVSSSHSESGSGSTITLPGTPAAPNQIIGGNQGTTSGLTSAAAGATSAVPPARTSGGVGSSPATSSSGVGSSWGSRVMRGHLRGS